MCPGLDPLRAVMPRSQWPRVGVGGLSTIGPMPIPDPSPDARAVVTGASQNIGAALATELAARGHSLIITARREDLLNDLAARLTDKYGVAVDVRPADLADPADRAKLCDELAARPISILCANAGTATFGPVANLTRPAKKPRCS